MSATADSLNRDTETFRLDLASLHEEVAATDPSGRLGTRELDQRVALAHVPLFVDASDLRQMENAVAAIIRVAAMPAYQATALGAAAPIAHHANQTRGLFFGYDFHLTALGPKLIEINTNAGGALLCSLLTSAMRTRAPAWPVPMLAPPERTKVQAEFIAAFREEFGLVHPARTLRRICIVDDAPEQQYLYPEFLLFVGLLERAGYEVTVASPSELRYAERQLWLGEAPIDLVYNRLVDFYLDEPEHAVLRQAYLEGETVITPHPRAHALFAAKQQLATLSNPERLRELGVDEPTIALLSSVVPETRLITKGGCAVTWEERKSWFMKPWHGYGSRATYRGDKLTVANFERITKEGGYVAQKLVLPSERLVPLVTGTVALRADLRAFVCSNRILLFAARLYRGQTTNMRTPGGGFAAVLPVPEVG